MLLLKNRPPFAAVFGHHWQLEIFIFYGDRHLRHKTHRLRSGSNGLPIKPLRQCGSVKGAVTSQQTALGGPSPGGGVYQNQPEEQFDSRQAAQDWIESQSHQATNAPPMFSARDSAPEKQFPLNHIERPVQSALRGMKNAPTVRVVARPQAIGLRSPVDIVPSGVTLAIGDICVFQSGVGSALDVEMVVFHELLHKGIQNSIPRSDYLAVMQGLARADSKVQQNASDWSATSAGKARLSELAKKYSRQELADQYEALATEEGLAARPLQ